MKVLVINSGSSSIKYQLFDMPEAKVVAKGLVQRIGEPQGQVEQKVGDAEIKRELPIKDHGVGLRLAMELLTQGSGAPIHSVKEIGAVGHRVVHGGEKFSGSVLLTDEVIDTMKAVSDLAPLHNPPNLMGIQVARELLPDAVQVGVFDTAFHSTLPPVAFYYAIPHKYYKEAGVRRYGFHGTSHRYVASRAAAFLGKPLDKCDLITCHLGNGSSMAAIKNGKSVDTTMGLTPLEGLVMGTRSGDIDPAIIFHLERKFGMSGSDIDKMLNKQSGLLGLSGSSNDVRELLKKRDAGDTNAALALEVFCYRIKKYVGAYMAVLGRLDALVFTAGIGENAAPVREGVCEGLSGLGLVLDKGVNATARGREIAVSTANSPSKILVIPTDEERVIAGDAYEIASK
jgi:acetate kinase